MVSASRCAAVVWKPHYSIGKLRRSNGAEKRRGGTRIQIQPLPEMRACRNVNVALVLALGRNAMGYGIDGRETKRSVCASRAFCSPENAKSRRDPGVGSARCRDSRLSAGGKRGDDLGRMLAIPSSNQGAVFRGTAIPCHPDLELQPQGSQQPRAPDGIAGSQVLSKIENPIARRAVRSATRAWDSTSKKIGLAVVQKHMAILSIIWQQGILPVSGTLSE
ncbi:hypothetical protein N431DRAFT_447085 [Stipitochalara longipes BDJ]|nr:hypothetical protein N431DRAFT_447085 [Stipitochalara longipes BDJ]